LEFSLVLSLVFGEALKVAFGREVEYGRGKTPS
jgi:hypothetical protein